MIQLSHLLNQLRWEAPVTESAQARWLLLIHQIPPQPNYLRVKVRRRLLQLGAVAIKQTVYALPRTEQAQEDFEWLRAEIVAGGGEAFICAADFLGGVSNDGVEAKFQAARQKDYGEIVAGAAGLRERVVGGDAEPVRSEVAGQLRDLRRRFAEVVALDFFGEASRAEAEDGLAELESWVTRAPVRASRSEVVSMSEDSAAYARRTWVTRQGIKVDRTSSAWLIRRFIDPKARFRFVPGKEHTAAAGEVRFDMFEAEFTHEGDRCTFEALLERFGMADPALKAVAEIVHDLDLKDGKFGRPETAGIGAALAGILAETAQDEERIARCSTLWEGLYAYFLHSEAAHGSRRRPGHGGHGEGKTLKRRPVRMVLGGLVGLSAALAAAPMPGPGLTTFSFDGEKAGAPPANFSFVRTGGGTEGRWLVQAEADAPSTPNVLAQVATDAMEYHFPIAVADAPVLKDLRLSVRCKPVSGQVDQACGLVWRYRDARNYYITRANALESDVRLYFVKEGHRRQIAKWSGPVKSGIWHTLAIEMRGDAIRVYFNGAKVMEAKDTTFTEAGKVGVWTKADSVTYFDDLTVAPR